ncbi:MAG TPA: hypothetical protein VFC75_04205, partial [Erysipelothrix sp.]|nr:hypothetical protein [Erysipelothrix sp.]
VNLDDEYKVKIHNSSKSILKVEKSENELTVHGAKAGKATLTILVETEEDSFYKELNFTVNKKEEKASIKFNEKTHTINRDDEFVIDFEVTPKNLDLARIVWESSDPQIASVENGSVFGHRVGTVEISARLDGIKETMEVIVIAPLEKIEFNPNSINLGLNETISIPDLIFVPYDTTVNRSVTYEVEDETIISIVDHKIIGLKSGETQVIAKVGNVEAQLHVKVDEQTLASDAHTLLLENTEIDDEGFHLNIRDFNGLEKDKYELYLPKKEI